MTPIICFFTVFDYRGTAVTGIDEQFYGFGGRWCLREGKRVLFCESLWLLRVV